ncbi:MAG: hypothetical protein JWM81_951 [Candidatus Saccharibacteria bacterium]|nr:hypothetical protein [Candidatus Saccharibacteria bacterium]
MQQLTVVETELPSGALRWDLPPQPCDPNQNIYFNPKKFAGATALAEMQNDPDYQFYAFLLDKPMAGPSGMVPDGTPGLLATYSQSFGVSDTKYGMADIFVPRVNRAENPIVRTFNYLLDRYKIVPPVVEFVPWGRNDYHPEMAAMAVLSAVIADSEQAAIER